METKICSKCNKEFPIDEFHWRDKKSGKRRAECKYCHNSYMNNKNAQNRQYVQKLKEEQCCKKCGINRHYLLDFHHIDPSNKVERIARLMIHSSLKDLLEEVKKCIVLCSNCHREFHFLNSNYQVTLEEYLLDDFDLTKYYS